MKFIYNDGGRKEAGFKGTTGDCVCRSVSIATGLPYSEIYKLINEFGKKERRKDKSSARTGVYKATIRRIMEHLGWEWHPTMFVGQGCKVHMREDELPKGRIVVNLSRHSAAVIDGVLYDTYDCTRNGTRCVYGYFSKKRMMRERKS